MSQFIGGRNISDSSLTGTDARDLGSTTAVFSELRNGLAQSGWSVERSRLVDNAIVALPSSPSARPVGAVIVLGADGPVDTNHLGLAARLRGEIIEQTQVVPRVIVAGQGRASELAAKYGPQTNIEVLNLSSSDPRIVAREVAAAIGFAEAPAQSDDYVVPPANRGRPGWLN